MIKASETTGPFLFILDEVFRGTNPIERVAAATSVLRYLGERHLVLAATHDIDISTKLGHSYQNAHFEGVLSNDGISFDHVLKKGRLTSQNAISLLDYNGYPEEIVRAARNIVGVQK